MFNFSLIKFNAEVHSSNKASKFTIASSTTSRYRSTSSLATLLLGALLLIGCQQQTTPENKTTNSEETVVTVEDKAAPQSDSAAAHIKQLQPIYVEQMLSLQRRLQAEYESLQAADVTTTNNDLLTNNESKTPNANETETVTNPTDLSTTTGTNSQDTVSTSTNIDANTVSKANINATKSETATNSATELNSSTEVGERDLTVLRSISAEPREPTILTEKKIIKSYEQGIAALYRPASEPLNSEETDTLINIAALVPQLFEHTELADRLNAKSPALARLIVQHQVWEQIEARQAKYMQEMKAAQLQEFESLMTKFNDTIKGYDEQIAKYEQTLREFK